MGVLFIMIQTIEMSSTTSLSYRSFILNKGWCDWVETGSIIGNDGNDGIVSIECKYTGNGSIMMQSFILNEGWSREVQNDEVCGDPNQSKQISAIRLKLVNYKGYHIFYRVCFNDREWSPWHRDYEIAGYVYDSRYIVGLEIRIAMEEPHVQYRAYIKNNGWSSMVGDNQIVGYEGKGLRIEALWIHYSGPGRIVLQGRVEGKGWLPEVECDSVCGTIKKGLRLEGIRIHLEGIENYHVYYCSYIKGMGWQPWVKDGEISGAEDSSLTIEAMRIRVANYTCLL